MKHWKLFAVFVLVIVFLFGIFIFFFPSQNPQPTTPATNPFNNIVDPQPNNSSISTFVASCYKTYIQWYVSNNKSANPSQSIPDPSRCFTSDFINQWPGIITNTEGDPVLLAQDYGNSWMSNINAMVSNQSQTAASVTLSLGSGNELRQLLVQLQLTSNGWRISSVTSAQ